ncbi:MAG: class I SAM-dependent methyltransferase, partial [Pseudonocardiaceae bacterium]
ALLRRGGTMLVEAAEHPGAGVWRGAARLPIAGGAAGPWFPWAVAGLPALAAIAELAGLQVGERYRADRCFIELRHVSGR